MPGELLLDDLTGMYPTLRRASPRPNPFARKEFATLLPSDEKGVMPMGHRTKIEIATDTLRDLVAHFEALAEMGVAVAIPAELADACQKIVRLAGAPMGEIHVTGDSVGRDKITVPAEEVAAIPRPSQNGEGRSSAATEPVHLKAIADVDPNEPDGPPRATLRDAILTVIQPGETVTVGDVVSRLEAAGIAANPDTVSNELSRRTREGVLERPARGTYRVIKVVITSPKEDHGPLAAERPGDQERMGSDAVTRTRADGAVM